jgi:hypothetical protein
VVIVTPAVRSQFGTSLGSEYAPAVLAAFGPRNGQIDVRVIDPHGAAAYRTELGKDLQVRKEAGASLLGYKSIVFSASAGRQLADGEVDSRLIEAIASLAGQVPVDILGFSNMAPGASPGLPLRFADLAETDGAAHMARSAYTRSMLAILGAEHPLYLRPAHTETVQLNGQAVLRIEFAAPSPLLLLGPQAS